MIALLFDIVAIMTLEDQDTYGTVIGHLTRDALQLGFLLLYSGEELFWFLKRNLEKRASRKL